MCQYGNGDIAVGPIILAIPLALACAPIIIVVGLPVAIVWMCCSG